MTDAETILALLAKIGVAAELVDADEGTVNGARGTRLVRVEEQGRQGPVYGYGNGSFVDFEFDDAENLVGLGIWES